MFIVLDKEWYLPGQTVEGRVFFDLFIPCFQNKLVIKLEGKETFPIRFADSVVMKELLDLKFYESLLDTN